MTAADADKLKQLLHAKKFGYEIWITISFSSIFGHVERVTRKRLYFKEANKKDVSIDQITTVQLFYGGISLDELDS